MPTLVAGTPIDETAIDDITNPDFEYTTPSGAVDVSFNNVVVTAKREISADCFQPFDVPEDGFRSGVLGAGTKLIFNLRLKFAGQPAWFVIKELP